MEVLFYILLFILGACLGSFLCCQARRLHLRTSAKNQKSLGAHSVCLHCHTKLKWYDNLPIISWSILKGKCRNCHKKIGLAELLSELAGGFTALLLGFSTFTAFMHPSASSTSLIFPLNWVYLILLILLVLTLLFLAIYDGLYGQLPTSCLVLSIICATIMLVLRIWSSLSVAPFTPSLVWEPFLSILILGGLYLLLYFISKGKWVGDGDWLLGTAIAIALGSPWLALITLFLSNLLACLIMAPAFFCRKQHKIYFGPFLVTAYIIVCAFADFFQSMI